MRIRTVTGTPPAKRRLAILASSVAMTLLEAGSTQLRAQEPPPPWLTTPAPASDAAPPGLSGSQPGIGPPSPVARLGSTANPVTGTSLTSVPPALQPQGGLSVTAATPGGTQASGPSQPTPPLGLMQKAWDAPGAHMGPGQVAPGLKKVRWTPGSTTQVTTREGMLTTILFPPDEQAVSRLVSDYNSFEVIVAPDHRSASIRPIYVGVDANLNIYGASGNVYSFYLRSVPWDNPTLADVNVAVSVAGMTDVVGALDGTSRLADAAGGGYGPGSTSPHANNAAFNGPAYDADPSARLTMRPRALSTEPGKEYAATAATGNGRIRTDLRILVPHEVDSVIAPVAAWRDDKFTYLDFGPRAASINEWPVASLVVDRTESPVGTRVSGPNRSVMVIEGIGNVSLRSGSHIVCVQTELREQDPRFPATDEPYADRRGPLQTPVDVETPGPVPKGVTGPGSGDYDPAATGGSSSRRADGTQDRAKLGITSGPYDGPTAIALAREIRRGYKGAPPAAVEMGPAAQGTADDADVTSGRTSELRITTADEGAARALCDRLRAYDHACRQL